MATLLRVREVLPVAAPPLKQVLAPLSSGCMMLFAVVEAVRAEDNKRLKSVSLVLAAIGAATAIGGLFI